MPEHSHGNCPMFQTPGSPLPREGQVALEEDNHSALKALKGLMPIRILVRFDKIQIEVNAETRTVRQMQKAVPNVQG